jgi:hypothetical protein
VYIRNQHLASTSCKTLRCYIDHGSEIIALTLSKSVNYRGDMALSLTSRQPVKSVHYDANRFLLK